MPLQMQTLLFACQTFLELVLSLNNIRELNMTDSLTKAIQALFFDEKYTDLTIKCGGTIWAVHKAVVCTQSSFFAKACDGSFKEAEEGVITLKEDDSAVVNGMLRFMYGHDYRSACESFGKDCRTRSICGFDCGDEGDPYNDGDSWDDGDSCGGNIGFKRDGEETHGFSPIVFDVHIHNIADKYDLPGLTVLAVASFKENAEAEWDNGAFVEAARVVYTEAADREQQLKDVVLSVAHAHASSLTREQQDEKQAFFKMACTVPALGTALWKEGSKTQEEYVRCPGGCGWRFPLDCMPDNASTTMHCLRCGAVSTKEQWKAVIVSKKGLAMDETNYFPDAF
ncbi:hypothetical protein LTR56_008591 [Elasticomyces elasticus]|nr:hypothetical protein LTR56_008591 [Elasticomyces elasticus]KAK3662197.1 hypothetical protein LTR22_006962 [Elasticomyces elasticus]KAK4916175.1 hypothetical protein LTR49_015816 [Elasticomyces elasticus]KAK5767961.1 hypothetical protein LTS12_001778 [Elasticomyces elasticus]